MGGGCASCKKDEEFDAKDAYRRLAAKQAVLADVLAKYMSEAGLERTERTLNAEMMVRTITIWNGTPTADFPECCVITNQSLCTGVLVHPRIVLTAAHCYSGGVTNVGLNCTSLADANAERIGVQRFRIHPDYAATRTHDIAVLVLQRNATTAPTKIASANEIVAARETTLVGFGLTELGESGQKRMVTVPIHTYPNVNEAETRLGFESDFEFTAGGSGFDSCRGDSGGPAYIYTGGQQKVAGLTSRGFPPSGACGEGGVYTRIDPHIDFIRRVASENGLNFP